MTAPVPQSPVLAQPPASAPVQETVIPNGPPVSGAGDDAAADMGMMMDAQYSVVEEPQGASETGSSEAPGATPAANLNPAAQASPATTVPGE